MQTISEVKVETMGIRVGIQIHDVCWFWWAVACCPRVCGLGTRCVAGED